MQVASMNVYYLTAERIKVGESSDSMGVLGR